MKGLKYIIPILLLSVSVVSGQTIVDSLIKTAFEQNYGLTAGQYMVEASQFKFDGTGKLPDPKLTLAALNLPVSSWSLDETPMSGILVGLTQEIPSLKKLKSQRQIAHEEISLAQQNLIINQNSVAAKIASNYFNYSYWMFNSLLINQYQHLSKQLEEMIHTRYSNGKGSLADLLKIQSYQSSLSNKLTGSNSKSMTALLNLGQLLNDENIAQSNLSPTLELDSDPLINNSQMIAPRLKQAEINSSLAQKKHALSKTSYWPGISVGVDYRFRKEVMGDMVAGEDFITAKIGFKIPIWLSKHKNKIKAAAQMVNVSQFNQKQTELAINSASANYIQSLNAIRTQISELDRTIIPKANDVYEIMLTAYEVGQVNLDELLDAHKKILDSENQRLMFIKSYLINQAGLKELTGQYSEVIK